LLFEAQLIPSGAKQKRDIKAGILILVVMPKLAIKTESTLNNNILKKSRVKACDLIGFFIPFIIKNIEKYKRMVSGKIRKCLKYLICQGKGPNEA